MPEKQTMEFRVAPGTPLEVRVGALLLQAVVIEDLGPLLDSAHHVLRLREVDSAGAEDAPGSSTFDLSVAVADLPRPRSDAA